MYHEIRNTQYAIRDTQYEHLHSTSVENPLQIDLFMQNKPNFRKSQMNVNPYNAREYENKFNRTLGQNKPNSNPIKPNFQKVKMNVNLYVIEDYRKTDDFAVRKNKPNSKPIQTQTKPISNAPLHKQFNLLHLKGCFIMGQLSRYWQIKWNCQINSLRKVVQKC